MTLSRRIMLVSLLIFLGSLLWSLTMIKSGVIYEFGMGFWGPNGHDGIWHISVARGFSDGVWDMPVFAGEKIQNYHVGFDLILFLVGSLTGVSYFTLYFQIFPVLTSLLVGVLVFVFVYKWKESFKSAFWSVFFVYFGGSLGYLVNLFRGRGLDGESMFWSQQAVSTLVNPPFSLSLVFLMVGLIILWDAIKKKSGSRLVVSILVFGLLVQIKAYAGALALAGLLAAACFLWIKGRQKQIFIVFFGAMGIFLVLLLPFLGGLSIVEWAPFWFLETMMGVSDRVGWERYYEAMVNYKLADNYIKGVVAYFGAFLIFFVGNLGTRLVSLFYSWPVGNRMKKRLEWVDAFLLAVIVLGISIPMLFVQSGTPWNTIQFFYYSLFFLSIIAGMTLSKLLKKGRLGLMLGALIVLFTIPTTVATLYYHYLPGRPPAKVSTEELEALEFLEDLAYGVILTYPYDEQKAQEAIADPPRPLHLYESTAYVSALTGKPTYLEDQVNLDITGFDWRGRREKVLAFLDSLDQQEARRFLRESGIDYVYWVNGQRARLGDKQLGMEILYENGEAQVYKVIQ